MPFYTCMLSPVAFKQMQELRERIQEPVSVTIIAFKDYCIYGFQNKIFREIISLSVVACSFIGNIGLKHNPETTASKLNLMLLTFLHTRITFEKMSTNFYPQVQFLGTSSYATNEFYCFSDQRHDFQCKVYSR